MAANESNKKTEWKMDKNVPSFIGSGAGFAGGAGLGIAGVSSIVAAAGTGAGGAAITTGLAALGGTMVGGLAVVAAIPVAAGVAGAGIGFGIVKGIEAISKEIEKDSKNQQNGK